MKKIISVLAAAGMAISLLAGCGGSAPAAQPEAAADTGSANAELTLIIASNATDPTNPYSYGLDKFKEVAEVIGKRSGHDFSSTSGDDYLNTFLSSITLLKKLKKEPSNMVFSRKVLKSYMKFEDIYAKTIDELNSTYEGCGDLMADLVENGDVDSEKDLNECADEMDKILPKPQLRWWNFK